MNQDSLISNSTKHKLHVLVTHDKNINGDIISSYSSVLEEEGLFVKEYLKKES